MLPAERKGSFFDKVINFFKSIFKKNKTHTEENITIENEMPNENVEKHRGIEIDAENYEPNYKTIDDVEETDFVKSIKAEDKSYIIFLQQKLKNNEIRVEDLTDQELDDMIKLYKSQLQVA